MVSFYHELFQYLWHLNGVSKCDMLNTFFGKSGQHLRLNSYHDVLPHFGPDFELRLYVIIVGKMQKVQICYNLQLLYLHEMQMIICMKNLHKIFEIL